MFCEFGHKKAENGCLLCECNDDPQSTTEDATSLEPSTTEDATSLEPCFMVECSSPPGQLCTVVGADDNGCGGSCECEPVVCQEGDHDDMPEDPCSGRICSNNQWTTYTMDCEQCPGESVHADGECCPTCIGEPCCVAKTAECLACDAGVPIDEYCASYPEASGCECPEIECMMFCEFGHKKAENGCLLCECNDDPQSTTEDATSLEPSTTEDATSLEPCFMVECSSPPGQLCTVVGADDNGCGGSCECEPDVDCDTCVADFTEQGGCECWKDDSCDEQNLVPEGCASCGNEAAEACGITNDCCKAMTAECLACDAGVTIIEYCQENPDTTGCNTNCIWSQPAVDVSINGGPIESEPGVRYFENIEDMDACVALCDSTPDCNGLTYNTMNQRCFLKKASTKLEPSTAENRLSAIRICPDDVQKIIDGWTFEDDTVGTCPEYWTCGDTSITMVNKNPCGNGSGCWTSDGEHLFEIASDSSQGWATSHYFSLPATIDHIQFLRGGGADGPVSGLYVKRPNGQVLCETHDGTDSDTLFEVSCSGLSEYAGEVVQIEVKDSTNSGWGKVYIDYIRLQDADGNNLEFAISVTNKAACMDPSALHGHSQIRLRYESDVASEACVSEVQKSPCNDGNFSPFDGSYTYETCKVSDLRYEGCYINDGDDRVIDHEGSDSTKTIEECKALASGGFFGMEYPLGSAANMAQCLPLNALPSMVQTSDEECEDAFDSEGRRLGGGFRLAVYSIIPTALESCDDTPHGEIVERVMYMDPTVPAPYQCQSETQYATCDDGTLGPWSGSDGYLYETCIVLAQDIDCEVEISECTSACEKAYERTVTIITEQEGNGAACPAAMDCQNGEGACLSASPSIAPTSCPTPDVGGGLIDVTASEVMPNGRVFLDFRYSYVVSEFEIAMNTDIYSYSAAIPNDWNADVDVCLGFLNREFTYNQLQLSVDFIVEDGTVYFAVDSSFEYTTMEETIVYGVTHSWGQTVKREKDLPFKLYVPETTTITIGVTNNQDDPNPDDFGPFKSKTPSSTPTKAPSVSTPTEVPSEEPTEQPSYSEPTFVPSLDPSYSEPTILPSPVAPTLKPVTSDPSFVPTNPPSFSEPTKIPSVELFDPTFAPSFVPSLSPIADAKVLASIVAAVAEETRQLGTHPLVDIHYTTVIKKPWKLTNPSATGNAIAGDLYYKEEIAGSCHTFYELPAFLQSEKYYCQSWHLQFSGDRRCTTEARTVSVGYVAEEPRGIVDVENVDFSWEFDLGFSSAFDCSEDLGAFQIAIVVEGSSGGNTNFDSPGEAFLDDYYYFRIGISSGAPVTAVNIADLEIRSGDGHPLCDDCFSVEELDIGISDYSPDNFIVQIFLDSSIFGGVVSTTIDFTFDITMSAERRRRMLAIAPETATESVTLFLNENTQSIDTVQTKAPTATNPYPPTKKPVELIQQAAVKEITVQDASENNTLLYIGIGGTFLLIVAVVAAAYHMRQKEEAKKDVVGLASILETQGEIEEIAHGGLYGGGVMSDSEDVGTEVVEVY